MPKPEVPSSADVAKKWAEVTPGRATYYELNTKGKGSKWEPNTIAAASNYKNAVQSADIAKRFAGGAKRVGGAKYDRKVSSVGVSRFGPGVTAAQADMDTGVAPYLSEIAATEIPARKPRGDEGNWTRSKNIGVALNKKRLSLMAAGPSV
jgi:hypothetical protein